MNRKNPEDTTFQVMVGHLTVSSRLPEEDIRVTIGVGDLSKITCAGSLSEDGLTVTWDHPFLFSAPVSLTIRVAIWTLPQELSNEWEKQPLGDQMVTDVASLLDADHGWQCSVPGLAASPAYLSLACRISDVLIVPKEHDCLPDLWTYQNKLYHFTRQFKNVSCVFTKIEMDLARLDLCPLGHTGHTGALNDLGIAYLLQYNQLGSFLAINKSVQLLQHRLDLCPFGHPEHVEALGQLAIVLSYHYHTQKNKADLDRAIEMQQRWLDLISLDDYSQKRALGILSSSLWNRYCVQGDMEDLNRAIEMGERSIELGSEDHIDHHTNISNLALCFNARYRSQGDLADLGKTIDLQETHLEHCPPGHQGHGAALQNLAISFWDRYDELQDISDIRMAINLFKGALKICPVQHHTFPSIISQLTGTIFLLHNTSQKHHSPKEPHLLDEAFETYQQLKKCGPAVSLDMLQALQEWVEAAEGLNHSSILEAYQTLLNTLDHFTSLASSLDSRHETVQAQVADAANNAFACATRQGEFRMAIEFLEQGRGLLWNQLSRFDISIAALQSQGHQGYELERKFTQLGMELRKHAEQSGEDDMDPYWQVLQEWESVVDTIRRLDGFSRFLLPPRFENLQRAAEYGPVIVVNASKQACDALIVLRTREPVHVSLPCSFDDVTQLCLQLSELTQDPHAYGDRRESWVKQTLRELWSLVVEPIFSVLQNKIRLPPGSRIWWCPTSTFTTLPLHAAGPHLRGKKNLFDIYVSSYAPSLSALLRAQDRIRGQRAARDASGNVDVVSFAAVGQGRPSANTKLGELPEVEYEIQRIQNETHMSPNVAFETITGAAATIKGAVQAFRDHRWIHLACHGAQHAEKPFESWFAMGDGKLTLMRIIQERYTNSEFAFLSACHTAVGDASTPDKVLHLAAGMQFAGFNGVIGTLWRVDDAVAHQVVTRFYKEMFRQPVLGFEHAAAALNAAVVATGGEVSLEKRIVFVHIGI